MSNLTVPGTNVQLADGDVVILSSYPDTKWILHNGWYTYAGQQQMGWYFTSIPYNEILPMSKDDLQYITVVSGGAGLPAPGHDCCHAPTPRPQMNPQMKWELDRSMVCVATIAERDLLTKRLVPHGKLVRVADAGAGPKYFAWNQIHSRWDEEKFAPDTYPVTSVNGQTGDVRIDIPAVNYPVTSVNGKTGDVVISEGVKSWNDLQDKPFGEDVEVVHVKDTFVGGYGVYIDVVLEDGEYTLVVESECPIQQNDTNTFALIVKNGFAEIDHIGPYDSDDELLRYRDGQIFHTLDGGGYGGCITIYGPGKSQLPEEYIPDTIARVSDLPTDYLTADEFAELQNMLNQTN